MRIKIELKTERPFACSLGEGSRAIEQHTSRDSIEIDLDRRSESSRGQGQIFTPGESSDNEVPFDKHELAAAVGVIRQFFETSVARLRVEVVAALNARTKGQGPQPDTDADDIPF